MKYNAAMLALVACGPLVTNAQSPAWGQCGGSGWTGATACVSGSTCTFVNAWYSQCIPGSNGGNPQPTGSSAQPQPTGNPGPNDIVGWGAGTSGGGNASPRTVTNCADFKSALAGDSPKVIRVNGMLSGCGYISPGSHTSILGVGSNSGFTDTSILFNKKENLIIRNMLMGQAPGGGDVLTIQYSSYVWVDHCTFKSKGKVGDKDDYDGLFDITHGSDFITSSYNVLKDHWKVQLIGHDDANGAEDRGKLRVTVYGNRYYNGATRAPMMRFGRLHTFNNLYQELDAAVDMRIEATGIVENCVFENVDGVMNAGSTSCLTQTGNTIVYGDPLTISKPCSASDRPTYAYSLIATNQVKAHVLANAGVGKITV